MHNSNDDNLKKINPIKYFFQIILHNRYLKKNKH